MKIKLLFLFTITFFAAQLLVAQTSSLNVKTWIPDELKTNAKPEGRIFLFIAESSGREPRLSTWPGGSTQIFAANIENWKAGEVFTFCGSADLTQSKTISLDEIPDGNYRLQVLWDQNREASQINAEENLHSQVMRIELSGNLNVELPLEYSIPPNELAKHELLKEVNIKSEVLTDWWGKEMRLKAAVLLPPSFHDEPDRNYPVRYSIAGYGGRYTRANRFVEWDTNFMDWWQSDESPEVINVFLDGEGPFGDCYQLDSENSGPYGTALTEELIPYIEKKFRGAGTPETRFLDGCSTGGWVSLALQLFYPGFFGGCFSYSPDQVDFENCQLINIYRDENAFYNEYSYLRPIMRDVTGEPVVSQKAFIQHENTLGWNNTYITSGGQFSAFTALFSPKGTDGLPVPLFDPKTGEIDHEVAEHWRKYDLKNYVDNNWETLGPKIQGKIWIWMGNMDNFYLNPALRAFDEMLKTKDNPKPDAVINFSSMAGHCSEYSHIKVLNQIKEKLEEK